MARIDKGALTKLEIITEATKQFLEKGYTNTSANAVAKALDMSQGNLTFHYPTKEHLLAILVDKLCDTVRSTALKQRSIFNGNAWSRKPTTV